MKIVHFSDTHLGFNDLDILDENGVNQREADFYKAFLDVVEEIEKIKPDYIIHTGDLFHRTSPSNRAISFAIDSFTRLDKLNIPIILIAGNHSTPRTNLSKPILSIFDNFKNLYTSYEQAYKVFEFEDIVFHTIPHLNDENKIFSELDICEEKIDKNKKNIMMLHCSVGASFLMSEFGEFVYPKDKEYIFEKMDYVALGHWHGFGSVGKHKNVYYSGSTERTSSNDKRNNKGYALVDLEDELKVELKEIGIRKIVSFELDGENFFEELEKIEKESLKDNIVEVIITNLTPIKSIDISNEEIKNYFENSLHVIVKREFRGENRFEVDEIEAISLQDYFLDYLKDSCDDNEYKRLSKKSSELFAKYEELVDDSE